MNSLPCSANSAWSYAVLEGTREWCIGRRGEILATAIWASFGFTILDASSAGTRGRAPLLHRWQASIVTPDHFVIRNVPLFMETKTKEIELIWRGGKRDGKPGHMPAGAAHGIDRRHYIAYRQVQHNTRLPVVICILCIRTGELRANTLDSLGEPYPSENDALDMVNWPVRKFALICEFDRRRMRQYFYQRQMPRPPPQHMPTAAQLRQIVAWLRPRQYEIERLREDLIARLEQRWRT